MNLLKLFKREPVVIVKTVQVPLPSGNKWEHADQRATANFFRSHQGRKLIEACRHKLFSEHLDACQTAGNAEAHNASMKGANNILAFMLYLAAEDLISGGSPVNEPIQNSDLRESEALNHRV